MYIFIEIGLAVPEISGFKQANSYNIILLYSIISIRYTT